VDTTGRNPYDSSGLQGRITDIDLRNRVIERIRTIDKITIKGMTISVKYAIVTLKGTVETFQERRIIGEEIWRIHGIFKILNLLKISNPKTAGPRI
jgi:osmotically-inducible protein OsmY